MAVKFTIKNGCVGCGMCYAQYANYFQENDDGSAAVNAGKILENKTEAEKIASVCPNRVISVESAGENKKQAAMQAIQKLKNFQGCPIPSKSSISFKKEEYHVRVPYSPNEGRYNYSSDRAAESAAMSAFKDGMYNKIDTFILEIISEYRVRYLKPYYTKSLDDGSVYAKTNAEVSKLLKEIENIIGNGLSNDFVTVNVFPNEDITWKMLNKGQVLSDEMISSVKREFDYSADDYDCYWDTDDMECYAGTDWRGRTKYKDMYCYRNVGKAFESLGKDLLSACYYARSSLEDRAYEFIESFVKEYNKKLKEVLKNKIQIAERAINNM